MCNANLQVLKNQVSEAWGCLIFKNQTRHWLFNIFGCFLRSLSCPAFFRTETNIDFSQFFIKVTESEYQDITASMHNSEFVDTEGSKIKEIWLLLELIPRHLIYGAVGWNYPSVCLRLIKKAI